MKRKSGYGTLGRAVPLLLASAACTPLLDRNAAQCNTDGDCAHFGGHPSCQNSVCVPSGQAPAHCFFGTPVNQDDFLNQCSTGYLPDSTGKRECLSFDNCERIPMCGTGPDSGLSSPPAPGGGTPMPSTSADAGPRISELQPCSSVVAGQPVYLTGSSNFPPLLKLLAPIIIARTGLTPVFLTTNSCTGVRSAYPAFTKTDHIMKNPPEGVQRYAQAFGAVTGEDTAFLQPTDPVNCSLPIDGQPVDVGESETFPETCGVEKDTASVREFPEAILPILFVVPDASRESAISAEAARNVFGGGRNVDPWTDPAAYYVRNSGTATQLLVGRAINLAPGAFWGIDQGTAENLASHLQDVKDVALAQQAIGILGADFYDRNRGNLRALAFKAQNQECAYLPDSNPNSRDKINVRDGHYPVWGPFHFFAPAYQTAISEVAKKFVDLFNLSPIPEELLDAFIDSSFVPDCAMMVQRQSTDLETPTVYQPRSPCRCHFETRVSPDKNTSPPDCVRCNTNGDCQERDPKHPACNFGFCERGPN